MLYLSRKLSPFNGYHVAIGAAVAGGVASAAVGSAMSKKSKSSAPSGGGGGGGFAGLLSDYMTAQQSHEMKAATDRSVAMADPFAQSRQLANQQLQSLMQHPGQMANDPSYQWAVQQGGQAVDRSLAAKHMTASGGALQELSQWGQGLASQQYNQRLAQLSTMASQGSSPVSAADNLLRGTQLSQGLMAAAGTGAMQSAGGLAQQSGLGGALGDMAGKAVSGMFGGGASAGSVDMTGFQNTSYSPWFQSQPTGGTYDYSTSYGTTPDYSGATSLGGTGLLSGMY